MPTSSPARFIAVALRIDPGVDRGVDALAADVHVSTRTIERAFVAETGLTLRQWRIRTRMEAAAALLQHAGSIEAVAYRVGYTNASAFRRAFKGHFGTSPSEFRRSPGRRPGGDRSARTAADTREVCSQR